jgi:hypothetical protein
MQYPWTHVIEEFKHKNPELWERYKDKHLSSSPSPSKPRDCRHGSKCKRQDCKFKHPPGWNPATNMMIQSSPANNFSLNTWGGGSMDTSAMLYVESVTFGDVIVPLEDTVTFGDVKVSLQSTFHTSFGRIV